MVTKLLSRAEMLSNPKALEAVKAEADGLIKAGTWSLDSVREKDDMRAEAKRTGLSVHFGQLMTIASINFFLSSPNICTSSKVESSTEAIALRTSMELPRFTKSSGPTRPQYRI